jgi:serine/threonine-protein kinase
MPILTDEERIGTTLADQYVVDALLGRGGMGTVFAGHHAHSARRVAIKILHAQHVRDPMAVRRFINEAKTAAAFRHPNVVDVLDVDVLDDGTVFLVLELLEGETLGERLHRERKLPLDQALAIVVPVLRALSHAHRMHIIHRDLKPDNIFLTPSKSGVVPVLLDFGIAKVLDGGEQSIETVTGAIIGTPQYMAPEQALGSNESSPKLDVYAMGVVLFECLSGQRPIDGPNPAAVLARLVTGQIPSLTEIAPEIPASIAQVVGKALAMRPEDRHESCDSFAAALLREAESLGVAVDLPDASERMTLPEGARSQRLRAVNLSDLTAKRVALSSTSDRPETMDTLIESTSAITVPNADGTRPNHSTFAPATTSRTSAPRPASIIGALLAFAIVGLAGVVTLRRSDPPTPTIGTTSSSIAAPPASASIQSVEYSAAPPRSTEASAHPSTPSEEHTTATPPTASNAAHDAGAPALSRRSAARGRSPTAIGRNAETSANGSANHGAPNPQPDHASSTPTRAGSSHRPPEVTREW